ncbi:hypothetical protein [Saccharopolyspora sp. 6V]|uniref:hypothetical protein n=1 Tax=Saccharopolyspora sp. 6V TaxID=2877239 RepID=UPI001CD3DB3A|nr:hypothetical protein [Saccharopolyspora sp. 6V]MCA1194435.1 hypothetical protein [Saccharopolyspora sp. 6V]
MPALTRRPGDPAPGGGGFGVRTEIGRFVPLLPAEQQALVTVRVPGLEQGVILCSGTLSGYGQDTWSQTAVRAVQAVHHRQAQTGQRAAFGRLHSWLQNGAHRVDLERAWAYRQDRHLARKVSPRHQAALVEHRGRWLPPDTPVTVRRHWNSPLRAVYRLGDVAGLTWSTRSGGYGGRANRAYVHGVVSCQAAVEGAVAHSCAHGPAPHWIKVCLTAVDNGGTRSVLTRHLRALADAAADPVELGVIS